MFPNRKGTGLFIQKSINNVRDREKMRNWGLDVGMGAVSCGANGGWCSVPFRLRFAPVPTLLRRSALAARGRHLSGTAARERRVLNGTECFMKQ